jgi:hypothetical protein
LGNTWVASTLLSLSVLLIHAQTTEQAIPQGRIRGVVVNEERKPIRQAEVWAGVANRPTIGALHIVETDEDGRFEIDRLEFDTFNVFAKKESEGYPDIGFAFYAEGLPPTVRLSPEQPVANVELKLGPKSGFLIGDVTDKVTPKLCTDSAMVCGVGRPSVGNGCWHVVN